MLRCSLRACAAAAQARWVRHAGEGHQSLGRTKDGPSRSNFPVRKSVDLDMGLPIAPSAEPGFLQTESRRGGFGLHSLDFGRPWTGFNVYRCHSFPQGLRLSVSVLCHLSWKFGVPDALRVPPMTLDACYSVNSQIRPPLTAPIEGTVLHRCSRFLVTACKRVCRAKFSPRG
jgi:hypothetical protein